MAFSTHGDRNNREKKRLSGCQRNLLKGKRNKVKKKHRRQFLYKNRTTLMLQELKRPQVIETRAFPRKGYALIIAKTLVKIHFVQYLNFN